PAARKFSSLDPRRETAAGDVFRKDPRNTAEPAHIETSDGMRVEAQVHPGLCFLLEIGLVHFRAEVFRPGRLDRQIHAPAAVPNPVNQPPSSSGENLTDLVEAKDDISGLPGHRNFLVMDAGVLPCFSRFGGTA